MSDDEVLITTVSGLVSLFVGAFWAWRLLGVSSLHDAAWKRTALVLSLPLAALVQVYALTQLAASDVREDGMYLFQYTIMGVAVLVVVQQWLAPLLSLSGRLDVAERENGAVLAGLLGAQAGFSLAWLGANFGEGPGWWCVAWTGAWSCGALSALWAAALRFGRLAERVTIDRDVAAGVRMAGWLTAMGLIAGRGAAGDWSGFRAAAADFTRIAGPGLVLGLVGLLAVERALRPAPDEPHGDGWLAGVVPAVVWVVIGVTWVARAGPW